MLLPVTSLRPSANTAFSGAKVRTYIGLGSNLNDPLTQLQQAFQALANLPQSGLAVRSSIVRSKPLAGMAQPDYCNAVAALDTALSAHDLLNALHAIEAAQGRVRSQHWAARTLDLDLLLYGNETHHDDALTVPHYALTERAFVLWPLLQIAPDLQLPDGRPLQDLAQHVDKTTLEWIVE